MTTKDLLDILDIRNKEALAYCGILKEKFDAGLLSIEDLQTMVDNLCDNMANSFIEKYKNYLEKDSIRLEIRRHLVNMGANREHSGKRVQEALYKKLDTFENQLEK